MRPVKEQLAFDRLASKARIQLVEVLSSCGEIINEKIGQRHDLRRSVLRKRSSHRRAAVSAAEQSMPYRGVGLVAKRRAWLQQQHPRYNCRSSLNKLPAVHVSSRSFKSSDVVEYRVRRYFQASTSLSIRSRYIFSWRTSSICCGPDVSRSIVIAPV